MKKIDVVKHFGTQQAVADALGIEQAAVSQWGEKIPQLRAYQIERITNGALKVETQHDKPSAAATN